MLFWCDFSKSCSTQHELCTRIYANTCWLGRFEVLCPCLDTKRWCQSGLRNPITALIFSHPIYWLRDAWHHFLRLAWAAGCLVPDALTNRCLFHLYVLRMLLFQLGIEEVPGSVAPLKSRPSNGSCRWLWRIRFHFARAEPWTWWMALHFKTRQTASNSCMRCVVELCANEHR